MPDREQQKFFFSYAREDGDFVLKVARDLRASGVPLWMDQLDIRGGERWDHSIERALNACGGMIVVLSPASVASNNVLDEVSFALEEHKLVVPVLLRTCEVPFRLRRVQRIDFTGDYNGALAQLRHALSHGSDTAPTAAAPAAPSAPLRAAAKPTENEIIIEESYTNDEVRQATVLPRFIADRLREKDWPDARVVEVEVALNFLIRDTVRHLTSESALLHVRIVVSEESCCISIGETTKTFERSPPPPADKVVVVLECHGRIDMRSADVFKEELMRELETGTHFGVDLTQVDYIGSAGMRVLMLFCKNLYARQARAVLINPQPVVREILAISKFDRVLPLVNSLEEAATVLGGSSIRRVSLGRS